jgi:hypothetical protein
MKGAEDIVEKQQLRGSFAVKPFRSQAAGRSCVLFWRDAPPVVVEQETVEALRVCGTFRSMPEHLLAARAAGVAGEDTERLRGTLETLAAKGATVSLDVALGNLPRSPSTRRGPLERIALLTRDRPAAAMRCLESLVVNAREACRTLQVSVYDDADTPPQGSREAWRSVAEEVGVPLRLLDRLQRSRFAQALASKAGVPVETVRTCLLGNDAVGFRRGAGTNSALLDHAGENLLFIDDDMLCEPAVHDNATTPEKVALSSDRSPVRSRYYSSYDRVCSVSKRLEVDYIGLHERWLTEPLSAVLLNPAADVSFSAAAPGLFTSSPRVAVTCGAFYGDSGSQFSWNVLFDIHGDRADTVRNEDEYELALRSRMVWRGVDRVTLGHGQFLQATTMGVAAPTRGEWRPPFVPFFRCSDNIFGLMLSNADGDQQLCYLPWALRHAPDPPRSQRRDDVWESGVMVRFFDLFWALFDIHSRENRHLRGKTWGLAFAACLRRAAELSPTALAAVVVDVLSARSAGLVDRIDALMMRNPGPSYWRRDADRFVAAHLRWIREGRLEFCDELSSSQGGLAFGQRLLGNYAEMIEVWPSLLEAAVNLGGIEEDL